MQLGSSDTAIINKASEKEQPNRKGGVALDRGRKNGCKCQHWETLTDKRELWEPTSNVNINVVVVVFVAADVAIVALLLPIFAFMHMYICCVCVHYSAFISRVAFFVPLLNFNFTLRTQTHNNENLSVGKKMCRISEGWRSTGDEREGGKWARDRTDRVLQLTRVLFIVDVASVKCF